MVWVGFLGLWAPVPARGPQAEKKRERRRNGDGSSKSQEIQGRKREGKCRRALHIYKQGVPGKEAERMPGWLSLWSGFAFWACGPRSPPEGPKQRRREKERRKATGTPEQQRARRFKEGKGSATNGRYIYIRGPVPGGWLSLWFGLAFWACGPQCNRRALHIYKGPRSRQGVPGKEAERMEPDGWLSLWFGLAFWACGPRSPLEGPKQRKRREEGKEGNGDARSSREREPGDSRKEARKKTREKCNRRALHIYKGPRSRQGVPGKEAERMEPDGWLSLWFGFAFWACGPEARGSATRQKQQRERARRFKEGSMQQTGVAYI